MEQITDRHLNLFTFFSQDEKYIENNLSRALAISLKNEELLFNEFLREIMADNYSKLLSISSDVATSKIDLQEKVTSIEGQFKFIYAIAIGSDEIKDIETLFHPNEVSLDYDPITDITIQIREFLFVIEVKRSGNNFLQQLQEQIFKYIKANNFDGTIIPVSYSWQKVVRLMENVKSLKLLYGSQSYYIESFLNLVQSRFNHWFPSKPFQFIQYSGDKSTNQRKEMDKRLWQAFILFPESERKQFTDRYALTFDLPWASEVIPYFNSENEQLDVSIWPGNTKGQGHNVYKQEAGWINKKDIKVRNKVFPLTICFQVKLCHFNRYISSINYNREDTIEILHTSENFHKYSGWWNRDKWPELERFFDTYFKIDWREECGWKQNFENTDRNYLTMSLGFEVTTTVNYSYLQEIDKNELGLTNVKNLLKDIKEAYLTLLNN